jgi:NAD-dependent SIR2 family protein deacetylase
MPKLAELFRQLNQQDAVFVDGTVGVVLPAVRCPDKAQVRVSSLVQVWQRSAAVELIMKTATSYFLNIAEEIGPQIIVMLLARV